MVRSISSLIEQHDTHRQLVAATRPRIGRRADLDAIIVPASRPAAGLDHAVNLAQAMNSRLVVLASREATAAGVSEWLEAKKFRRAAVVDIPVGYGHSLLRSSSAQVADRELPEICKNPNGDLSIKRNIGLLLARMLGWERIFFMDDDIRNVAPSDLHATVSMLSKYKSAGMRVTDFPDNSVVCHAHRETGAAQDIFISGSVLAVSCMEDIGFFPEIYNEDWLFFYDDARSRRLGWSKRNVTQLPYDPFDQPSRAELQEFGDVLAEGLYALLDDGAGIRESTCDYWKSFLDARWRFLNNIIDRYWRAEEDKQVKIIKAVQTAMICLMQIQPEVCDEYVRSWRKDLATWKENVRLIPKARSIKLALTFLGLSLADNGYRERFWLQGVTERGKYVRIGATAIAQAATLKRFAHEQQGNLVIPGSTPWLLAPKPDQAANEPVSPSPPVP